MLARARLKLKSAESSIAFIQEQHTRTLEGLHQEIQKLQQKNARLTFELAVHGTSAPKPGKDKCKHAEEIQAYKSEVNSLQTTLTTCREEIKILKHKLKTAESNLTEEVAERDSEIGRLSAEVERRARIIAHLTKQLHQMRMEFTRYLEDASRVTAATVVQGQDHSGSTVAKPPATAVGQIRRRTRRATSSAIPHNPDAHHEKTVSRRSLPTPVTSHPSPTPPSPSASPRPPSTSPPPKSRQRAGRVLRRTSQTATNTPDRSPPSSQRPLTNLDPVRLQKPPPDIADILRNNSVNSTPNLSRAVAPILPPISTNPSLLAAACQRNTSDTPAGSEGKRERRLLVKEEVPHGKSQAAWQELHQSGSD